MKKENLELKMIIAILIIMILILLVYGLSNRMTDKKEEPIIKQDSSTQESQNNEVEEVLDTSIDPQTETIIMEGVEESKNTLRYISSLGYSIRYNSDLFVVKKQDGFDVYSREVDYYTPNLYFKVEAHKTSFESEIEKIPSYEETTTNGYKTIYFEKDVEGVLETYYYIKADDGFFLIVSYYPNTTEYIEGIGRHIKDMIKTFKIN